MKVKMKVKAMVNEVKVKLLFLALSAGITEVANC